MGRIGGDDLVEPLLVYDSENRLLARPALLHIFFAQPKVSIEYFDFEQFTLSAETGDGGISCQLCGPAQCECRGSSICVEVQVPLVPGRLNLRSGGPPINAASLRSSCKQAKDAVADPKELLRQCLEHSGLSSSYSVHEASMTDKDLVSILMDKRCRAGDPFFIPHRAARLPLSPGW